MNNMNFNVDPYRVQRTYADRFGKMLQFSASHYKLDSRAFIKTIMTDKRFEDRIIDHDAFEWCDQAFLCCDIVEDFGVKFKQGETLDQYVLWFAGYLYKWWIMMYHKKPFQVYKILPIETLEERFDFYHTQGWDFVIQDATDMYNKSHKRKKRQ